MFFCIGGVIMVQIGLFLYVIDIVLFKDVEGIECILSIMDVLIDVWEEVFW